MKLVTLLSLLPLSAALAFGLDPSGFDLLEGDGSPLLTPSFGSSMAFSFTSGGGRSWSTGTYLGTMGLLLHPDVSAEVSLGYTRLFDFSGPDAGMYLGGIGIDWRPSDSFLLELHVNGAFSGEALQGN